MFMFAGASPELILPVNSGLLSFVINESTIESPDTITAAGLVMTNTVK